MAISMLSIWSRQADFSPTWSTDSQLHGENYIHDNIQDSFGEEK